MRPDLKELVERAIYEHYSLRSVGHKPGTYKAACQHYACRLTAALEVADELAEVVRRFRLGYATTEALFDALDKYRQHGLGATEGE